MAAESNSDQKSRRWFDMDQLDGCCQMDIQYQLISDKLMSYDCSQVDALKQMSDQNNISLKKFMNLKIKSDPKY